MRWINFCDYFFPSLCLIMKNIKNLWFTFFLNCSWWRCLLYVFLLLRTSSFWSTSYHRESGSQSFERKISFGTFGLIVQGRRLLLLLRVSVFLIGHFRIGRHRTVWLFHCLGFWTMDGSWFLWFLSENQYGDLGFWQASLWSRISPLLRQLESWEIWVLSWEWPGRFLTFWERRRENDQKEVHRARFPMHRSQLGKNAQIYIKK